MAIASDHPGYRPLLTAVPRAGPAGVKLDVGRRTVTVEGDRDELIAAVALCDGRRTVVDLTEALQGWEAEEVEELVRGLAAEGAVVDCTEAWRIFHRVSGVDTELWREPSDEELRTVLGERFRPLRPGPTVPLKPSPTALDPLTAARRSSWPTEAPHPVDAGELGAVLERMYSGSGTSGRPVPSGGGIYPLVIHVALREGVGATGPGVWWYEPAGGCLVRVSEGAPVLEPAFVAMPNTVEHLARVQPVVFVSAEVERGARRYASRAYRLASIEAGAAMQNAYLVAADLGLPVRAMLGIDDAVATELLELPDGTVPVLALFLGL